MTIITISPFDFQTIYIKVDTLRQEHTILIQAHM